MLESADLHRAELADNWQRAQRRKGLPRITTSARYLDGYRIELTFEDGKRGVLDLKDELWGQVFEPLKDVELFKSFKLDNEMDTIVWPTGTDLAPEFLYERAIP
ncbi:MAG TPA: DUF2442 domain-containing protein [Planctomycetota bacterium]|nr:DUF2442 domain-containing protein [Planctomycetota bacterium]